MPEALRLFRRGVGACFDNFVADSFDPPRFEGATLQPDGRVKLVLRGTIGRTNAVDRTTNLPAAGWTFFTNVINSNPVIEFLDVTTNSERRFYRARPLP
jgi:hypothetical protein